jgi:hypothetical protein
MNRQPNLDNFAPISGDVPVGFLERLRRSGPWLDAALAPSPTLTAARAAMRLGLPFLAAVIAERLPIRQIGKTPNAAIGLEARTWRERQ